MPAPARGRHRRNPRAGGRAALAERRPAGQVQLHDHPNYFGDAAVWTGLTFIALEAPFGWLTVLSPLVMAHYLVNVSGKAMLERSMEKRYAEYARYKATTSGFFPAPPKQKP